jgi:hypothetical protein
MKPLFFAPKGFGRPWYPLFVGKVQVSEPVPDGSGYATATLTTAGPIQRKRVGLRLWISPAARKRLVA